MKLISLNIAVFEKNNQHLKEFLKKEKPDILCLQEVARQLGPKADSEYISLPPVEEATPDLSDSFFGTIQSVKDFRKADFHGKKNFVFEYGDWVEWGLLIRSLYPISNGRLDFVQGTVVLRTDWTTWPEEDNRAVQITDLAINYKEPNLRLINYHGLWSRGKEGSVKTLKANETILKVAQEVDFPVIICGDFDLFPDTLSMQILNKKFESLLDTFKIKTTRPQTNELSATARNVVDYIFVSKGIKVNNFSVPDIDVSDHLPLILDFELF